MIVPAPASSQQQLNLQAPRRPRLLIVSDSPDGLARLRAALNLGEIEITSAASIEELSRACRDGQDLAVVDVSPAQLTGVLKALRADAGCAEAPVLVEASRLPPEPGLAGVLPKYRAMPCSQADLVALARRRIAPGAVRRGARKML
jgi:hypothetical protein